ncbi:sugar ABC transporter permease [Meridianimarinicoccus roseus]|jgi:multiple sugar transport system permease protein|uniref:Sugar ABC transporter permease n=1 Tax=Meridianimarinicoccus roseus TaxID=2072018 RepID=A0A2V2LFT3_9RHOB|nr:sugar ABC transporter permease [Meridianimarinicoccus roseus]PWR02057.1 sugar ABC transporter permease [Meridianimarinicoccus roseus]
MTEATHFGKEGAFRLAGDLFRAREHSTEVEARPISDPKPRPTSFNPPAPKRYYLYLMAPAIAILAFISLYPFFWLIVLSLQDVDIGGGEWVGFKNYARLLQDPRFKDGWILLLQYSAMCLGLQLTIGMILAVIVNNSKYEKFLVTALLMPMMMAPAVAGLLWLFLYNGTFGWYHWIFQSIGLLDSASILATPGTALYGIVLVDVWQWTPLITLIALAGLKRVPRDQLEANMVDGASPMRNFFAITLPNLYPVLLIAVLLRFMDNFRFIDHILVLTGGGPGSATKILPVYLFEVAFKFFKLGRGAAIALTLLIVTIVLGMILVRVFDKPKSGRT